MAKRANEDLRDSIKKAGVKYWQVADALNISNGTLSVWMRHEMTTEKKKEVIHAIEKCEEEDLDLFE